MDLASREQVSVDAPGRARMASDRDLTIRRIRHRADFQVCAVSGQVDMASAPVLGWALREFERHALPQLIVDLSRVDFIGVAGVRVLATSAARARAAGRWLSVVASSHAVTRALSACGEDRRIPTFQCLSDAMRAVEPAVTPVERVTG